MGDVRNFTVNEKRSLLRCLDHDAERDPQVFGVLHELDSRWQDLATPEMEETFREILTSREGSQGKQTVALAVLRSLERKAVVPGVTPVLLDVVRDGRCWPAIRDAAFEAYLRQSHDEEDTQGHLKTLLAEVYEEVVPDPLDTLLGLLLSKTVPGDGPPFRGWTILARTKECGVCTVRCVLGLRCCRAVHGPQPTCRSPGFVWSSDSRTWRKPEATSLCPTG